MALFSEYGPVTLKMTTNKEYIFSELQKATKGLAATSVVELQTVFGDDCLDELALDFSLFVNAATPFIEKIDSSGLKLLLEIDGDLGRISGVENYHMWTHEAFLEDHNWSSIRRKAEIAVQHFSWS